MKNVKDKKLVIIISIIIILILILFLVIYIMSTIQNKQNEIENAEKIKSYTSISDFKTIGEVATYLDCKYIKEEKSKDDNYKLDIYMQIKLQPYTEEKSNETFYNNLIGYITYVLKFDNFRIIDKENNIAIEVICDKENEKLKTIMINGETDYFAKRDSELEIKKYTETEETSFTIQSDIVNKLISNDWKMKDSEFGTKESTFNLYDIYFDEGIEVRKVDGKVFNIVFTEKYKETIVNNIGTLTNREDIIKVLGEPTFENKETGLIGYKGDEIYIFINEENQISVYRNEKKKINNELLDLVNKYQNNSNNDDLITDIKQLWKDYDKFKNTQYSNEIKYTFRGLEIKNNSINIYSNYIGKINNSETLIELMKQNEISERVRYINNDLVFVTEIDRNSSVNSTKYALENYVPVNYEQENIQEVISKEFLIYKTYINENTYTIKFVSKTKAVANSELKEYINSGIWINDNIYVYGINNRGLYAYNAKSRQYQTLITGNEEFNIIKYENNILKYDDKELKIKK